MKRNKTTLFALHGMVAGLLAAGLGSRGDALTIQAILRTMTPQDFFDLANQPVPESEYILAALLPEELRTTYEARTGTLRVITTPAGETGMDSPYAMVGDIEVNADSKPIAKWTAQNVMTEQLQRELQSTLINIRAGVITGNALDYIRNTVVNWLNKVIRQSFSDRHELMRGETLTTGQLALRGGTVDYGVPSANKFPKRTGANAYGASNIQFWRDMRAGESQLRNVRARIMSMNTLHYLLDSAALQLAVTSEVISAQGNVKTVTIRKVVNNGQTFSQDARDTYTLIGYARTVKIRVGKVYADQQVLPDGKIILAGTNDISVTSTDGTVTTRPGLGRTHVGPTVEGDSRPGVWVNAYTPEGLPMQAVARGAANSLTILDAPEKLIILDTEVS